MNTRKHLSVLVAPLLLGLLTGCTSLSVKKPDVWPFNISDNKPGMPTQVVANWTDTMLYNDSQVPVRGFGGRILFYVDGKKDPIKVEGSLVVYAFEEKNSDPNSVKPDRKFVFTKEQLESHYSKSKIGHSYSVWLPWDDAGGDQKEISLIVRFMPEKGNVIHGDQTKQILPGKTPLLASKTNLPSSMAMNAPIQQVSYQQNPAWPPNNMSAPSMEVQNGASRTMTTTTIAIPPSSLLKSPQANVAPMNGGTYESQAMPMAVPAHATPNGQMPLQPYNPGAYQAANPAMSGGVSSMNSWCPPNQMPQQPDRFGPGQPQAPGASISRVPSFRAPWQPSPAGQGFGPGTSPSPAINRGVLARPEGAGSATY
jgi:hypothetical protein